MVPMPMTIVVVNKKNEMKFQNHQAYTVKLFFSPLSSMVLKHLSSHALGDSEDQFCGIYNKDLFTLGPKFELESRLN